MRSRNEAARAVPRLWLPRSGDRQAAAPSLPEARDRQGPWRLVRPLRGAPRDGRPPPPADPGTVPDRKAGQGKLAEVLACIGQGAHVDDRRTTFGEYLERRLRWWESERELKPSTLDSYREAIELYYRPGLGHVRLADLRDHHFRDLYAAMRKINRSAEDGGQDETLRRLLEVRAKAPHAGRRLASTRPLTEARIKRIHAVATFLDSVTSERLYALFHVAAYCGLRRSELADLGWADVDLEGRRLHIRQAQVDDELDSTKSDDSDRLVPIDEATAAVLGAWRKAQLEERLAWGPAWTDAGRVFTREDGTALRPRWISQRFGDLAARAGAPLRERRRTAAGAADPPRRDGLPPICSHDFRHGTATMLLAAGAAAEGHLRGARTCHGRVHDGRLHRGGRGARRRGNGSTRSVRPAPQPAAARDRMTLRGRTGLRRSG